MVLVMRLLLQDKCPASPRPHSPKWELVAKPFSSEKETSYRLSSPQGPLMEPGGLVLGSPEMPAKPPLAILAQLPELSRKSHSQTPPSPGSQGGYKGYGLCQPGLQGASSVTYPISSVCPCNLPGVVATVSILSKWPGYLLLF